MSYWKLTSIIGILVLLVLAGTIGYRYLENWSYVDGFYMTVIVLVVVVVGYGVNTLAQRVLEMQFATYLGRRKMEKETKRLKDHFILCGAGRVGSRVIKEFTLRQVPFVVVEKDGSVVQRLTSEGCLAIHGDASDEEILHKAGVERARGLIAAISTDADNVYVTLTAKGI